MRGREIALLDAARGVGEVGERIQHAAFDGHHHERHDHDADHPEGADDGEEQLAAPVIMVTASCESCRSRSPNSRIRALIGAKSVSLVANNAADDCLGARAVCVHSAIQRSTQDRELLQPRGLFGIGDDLVRCAW